MRTRTMVESLCGGELLYKNANAAWDFLEDLGVRHMSGRQSGKPLVLHLRFLWIMRISYLMTSLLWRILCFIVSINLKFFNLLNLMITFLSFILMIFS